MYGYNEGATLMDDKQKLWQSFAEACHQVRDGLISPAEFAVRIPPWITQSSDEDVEELCARVADAMFYRED